MSFKSLPDGTVYKLKYKIQQLQKKLDNSQKNLKVYKDEVRNLNVQLKTLIQNIESQLAIAARIQKYLIPTEILQISGFDFSTKYITGSVSGGDYFDIFRLKDKQRFAVIVASSSGHAMAALFLSVLIQLSSQMEAKKGVSPSKILKSLGEKLSVTAQDGQISNVFLLIINRRNLEMTYCSAGDIMAWFQPHQSESIQSLLATSSSLGSANHKEITEVKISLNAKDRIVIATPGLVSAMKNKDQSVKDLLVKMKAKQSHDLRNEIIYQAQKSNNQRDMTVLVIDVKDRILKLTSAS